MPVLDVAVPAITIIALLAVGMDLTPADFARVRQHPRLVVAGLLWPLVTLPLIALVLIILVVSEHADTFVSDLRHTVPLAVAFVVLSFAVGWLAGTVSRGSAADRFTIASEFATRNIAVATSIAVTLLGRLDFALFATAYFLTEMPLMLLAIAVFRAWHDPSAATALESGASR